MEEINSSSQRNSTHEFRVLGMHCVACAHGVEKKLLELGASAAHVNLSSEVMLFEAPPETVPTFLKGVQSLGYDVHPLSEQKDPLWWRSLEVRCGVATLCTLPLLLHMLLPFHILHSPWFQALLATPVFLIGILHFGSSAMHSLRAGLPNMDVLIIIGVSAAYLYSAYGLTTDTPEAFLFFETAAAIVSFVLLGNVLERRASRKTLSAIEELAHLQPQRARKVLRGIGKETFSDVDAKLLTEGDTVFVTAGEKIPADGEIVKGESLVDESMVTGESLPAERNTGSRVIGGTIVTHGSVHVLIRATGKKTVLATIIQLVRDAQRRKPPIQRFGDVISSYFVPFVVGFALCTFGANLIWGVSTGESLLRAIAVLVVACPCAMGLATPTAVMVAVGRGAKLGILFRGGDIIEKFSAARHFVFDKTGTLTSGAFSFNPIQLHGACSEQEVRAALRGLEEHSSHPLAVSLRAFLADVAPLSFVRVTETKGLGIHGETESGDRYMVGSKRILPPHLSLEGDVFLLKNDVVVASLTVRDTPREGVLPLLNAFQREGLRTTLLSGDSASKCRDFSSAGGFDTVFAEMTPEAKLRAVEEIEATTPTAYVGDGINDTPALSRASVGVSLSTASSSAINSAGVVILEGPIERIYEAWLLSRRTMATIKQNLFWAFFYNVLMIPLAALGYLSPAFAALAMGLSDVFVIGNSLRLRTLPLRGKTPYDSQNTRA